MNIDSPGARAVSHGRRMLVQCITDARSNQRPFPDHNARLRGHPAFFLAWRRGVAESIDQGRGRYEIRSTHKHKVSTGLGIQW